MRFNDSNTTHARRNAPAMATGTLQNTGSMPMNKTGSSSRKALSTTRMLTAILTDTKGNLSNEPEIHGVRVGRGQQFDLVSVASRAVTEPWAGY
jgi:hypothetical protein